MISRRSSSPRRRSSGATASRLLALHRAHRRSRSTDAFHELPDYLQRGRLPCDERFPRAPGAACSAPRADGRRPWSSCCCAISAAGAGNALAVRDARLQPGTELSFGDGELTADGHGRAGGRQQDACSSHYEGIFLELLEQARQNAAAALYQGRAAGRRSAIRRSIPATPAPQPRRRPGCTSQRSCCSACADKGVSLAYVTLHVGLGTFRPVKADKIEEHRDARGVLHAFRQETARYRQPHARRTAAELSAVGTTSCRTLESFAERRRHIAGEERLDGYFHLSGLLRSSAIDALITNFHLPESTLIMLVSALAGRRKCPARTITRL